ncbi:MAG: HD-GYP domain-containing protein [Gammaproteobacteria bacterium]
MSIKEISIDQLCVGHYVKLDGAWTDYPFMFRAFKIKTNKQIKIIVEMGVKTIMIDTARSDVKVPELELATASEDFDEDVPELDFDEEVEEEIRAEEISEEVAYAQDQKARKDSLKRSEAAFSNSTKVVKDLMKNMRAKPKESLAAAEDLVNDIVDSVVENPHAAVQLVNIKSQDENSYFHIVNVTMLSLIVGKELGLNDMELNHLGVGAMLHTFGQLKIPTQILRKTKPLTDIERRTFQLYPRYGVQLAEKVGKLPKPVIEIIGQHCEFEDGSGFPDQLVGSQITKLSKIVVVANAYDDYCNNIQNSKLLTPYEAMSFMYSQKKFDKNILSIFINRLGVYPPGTVVKLSDGNIAGVIAINRDNPLNPTLLVYSTDIPKEDARIIDLATHDELEIKKTIRRNEVPREVLAYLNFGDSLNYYTDPNSNN